MSTEVSDHQLRQLLAGTLSPTDEQRIENLLSMDAQLRWRLDQMCGGDTWTIGSAPLPAPHHSVRLNHAMESVTDFVTGQVDANPQYSSTIDPQIEKPVRTELPKLSGFHLIRQVGQGGMGVVYEGLDEALGRRVAVKFIQPMRAASTDAKERLLREAKATAALHHDNIVTIHAIQTVDGTPALIQQYIDGYTLQEQLDRAGALPIEQCIDLARQLARGLAAAHQSGIIHRDLKPGNVLIEQATGKARLADFGMARFVADLKLSSPDMVSGTPAFMSPEQTQGLPTDKRSDLFSLGSILFNAVTGRAPFVGDDPFVVMDQVRHHQLPSVLELRPETPPALANAIARLTAKAPEDRLASAEDLLQILDGAVPNPVASRKGSAPWFFVSFIALGLVGSLVAMVWLNGQPDSPVDRSTPPQAAIAGVATPSSTNTEPHQEDAVHNTTSGKKFRTLISAVKAASHGDTLEITSDLETEQVDISNKSLTVQAAAGVRPKIRASQWALEHSPFLFRTDSNLSLKGLDVDWQVRSEPVLQRGSELSATIASREGTVLTIVDCSINRSAGGIAVGALGNIVMHNCRISGGEMAVSVRAQENEAEFTDCTFHCNSDVVVFFPAKQVTLNKPSVLKMTGCTFRGDQAIDFVLLRHPDKPIDVSVSQCVFQTKRLVQVTALPSLIANLNWSWVVRNVVRTCMKWQERACSHADGLDYLMSRRQGAARQQSAGMKGLGAWQEFWGADAVQSAEVVPGEVQNQQ